MCIICNTLIYSYEISQKLLTVTLDVAVLLVLSSVKQSSEQTVLSMHVMLEALADGELHLKDMGAGHFESGRFLNTDIDDFWQEMILEV